MSVRSGDAAIIEGRDATIPMRAAWRLLPSVSAASLLVAIPAYNEERFIGSVVLQAIALGFDVLVIDDGSTDRTVPIARAAGAVVEVHDENRGKAAALNTA